MNKTIHFICGLPRSGSTLLANILAQNPAIHSTPTSACHETLFALRNQWDQWIEHQASSDLAKEENLQRMLNAMIHSYHGTDRPIVMDKGRGWTAFLELAEFALGRPAKVLVPVRNINQILASFEKIHRKEAHKRQQTGEYFQAQTVQGRCDFLRARDQVLGLAYNRLKDVGNRGLGSRLCLVEFDDLTHNPAETMEGIYKFLELPAFQHDFDNVEQYTWEDDRVYGSDLHTIKPQVRPAKDDSVQILGAAICKQFTGTEFWRQ